MAAYIRTPRRGPTNPTTPRDADGGEGLLGEVDIAEEADQVGQDAGPFLSEDAIEPRYQYTSEGRISTAPP
jgi:hypothetical protein